MRQIGISPKVYVPALAQLVGAIVLLAFGLDVEGRTALATAVGTFAVGYRAAPGPVDVNVGAPSDELLGPEAVKKIVES